MALPYHALKQIAQYLKGAQVLSLGYPDILAKPRNIAELFGFEPEVFTDRGSWHGINEPLPETFHVFEKVGAKLSIVDFTIERGMERIVNLNEPHDLGKFDLVIDPGTLEHCFNVGQAFMNAAQAVKPGGRILHLSPMTMVNHGFFNFCPTLFYDFYHQNGWDIDQLAIVPITQIECKLTEKIDTHTDYLLRCVAKRLLGGALKFPVQTKYLEKLILEQQKAA